MFHNRCPLIVDNQHAYLQDLVPAADQTKHIFFPGSPPYLADFGIEQPAAVLSYLNPLALLFAGSLAPD